MGTGSNFGQLQLQEKMRSGGAEIHACTRFFRRIEFHHGLLGVRTRLKRLLFRLLGKDPEAVVVCFRSGDSALADAMCAEIRRLEPTRRLFEVTLENLPEMRQRLRAYRIGLAPVLFDGDPAYRPLRRAALLLAPRKILAYNSRLERHHLSLSQPIASLLFWRGVPLDRIFLRPAWFPFRRDRTARPTSHRVIEGRAPRESRRTVAVLSPYFPYPLSHGGAVRIFNLLREIALEFDVELYSFVEDEVRQQDLGPVLEFVTQVYTVKKPRYREPRWSTLKPPEVCEYLSPEMLKLWRARRAQIAQVEYTSLAPYGGDILVEHDITWDLYAQVLARKHTLAAWWDWKRWQRFEYRAVRQFRSVVTMSEKDRALLGIPHARVIENGVDLERFQPEPEPSKNDMPGRRLLFIGSFRHFPNVIAFRFLTEQILPLVPDAELTVVAGPDPWPHWSNLTGTLRPPQNPGVRILEFIADVRPLYREANVVVVTTLESAGTNVKVLEALAMERAVVSTTSGCAGLGLEHGATAWIADSAVGLAHGIQKLLDDDQLRLRMARAGRDRARKHCDWRAIGRRQRALLREKAGDPLLLRAAAQEDLGAIARIQAASPEASHWEPHSYLGLDCTIAYLRETGEAAGFVVFRTTAPGEREILNLAVEPSMRRKGVARRLLEEVLSREEGAWFLEVRESNAAAIALYEVLGFRPMGLRKNYYSEPSEAGIVMRFLS
jgi:ribosomal protein S18 acetylase RimI-like enzyme